MNAHAIYEKCRSKEIITQQNRLGLSVSYNTIQKYRSNLAKHAIKSSENTVPLPSHFSKEMFTVGAFDNFYHKDRTSLSGLSASHDTVSTLFQVKPSETSSKPNKSEYDLKNVDIIEKLDCQTVKACYKVTKCIERPDNFPVKNELYLCESELKKHKNKEFIINVIKSNFTRINMDVPTWAAMRSLVNEKPLLLMQVGFLSFVPVPVTDYFTVYTAVKNFLNVVNQLKQQTLPLFCDEGVFRTVLHIYLNHNKEFQNLLPMLGAFHMAKIAQHSAGKYIRDSGFEDALIETKTLGIKVVQSVFDGTH